MTVTMGADPEVFILDKYTGGVVPVVGLVGGTKKKPEPVKGYKGYALQEDGVAAEFNIPPQEASRSFTESIMRGLGYIDMKLAAHKDEIVGQRYMLDRGSCSRLFSPALLTHPQTREFGCDADFDAYRDGAQHDGVNPKLLQHGNDGSEWRFAGGHLHLSFAGHEDVPPSVVAKMCDVFIALPAVSWDKQGARRKLYGQAGRFRVKPYGIEYRTMSNKWAVDRNYTRTVGRGLLTLGLLLEAEQDRLRTAFKEIPWADVQETINTENVEQSYDLLDYIVGDLGLREVTNPY